MFGKYGFHNKKTIHMKMLNIIAFLLATACVSVSEKKEKPSEKTTSYSLGGRRVYTTLTVDSANLRLANTDTLDFVEWNQPVEKEVTVFVDPDRLFQPFHGIGAALTDAAAETFYKLPQDKQAQFLKAHFDKRDGIGYTIARTNINSCDFSSDMYTYVKDNDSSLASFDIAHDKKYKIPFIKAAKAAASDTLHLFGSPWSPPAWMKSNNNMLFGGSLKPEYYSVWANYFVRFIKAYEAEGIPVWGLSIQNEPMATQIWESCIYTAEQERDFLRDHLGPALAREGLQDKKIIVWDHNRDLMYQRAQTYFDDPAAAKYAWGLGFHWYEDWSGGDQMFDNVRRVHEAYPDKALLFTEGCNGPYKYEGMKSWALGERYARSMINDFNNGMTGFTDWNILLDETGGPNHVKNFCYAPVHADTRTGELIYTNAYYYIGHFSKFIKPGARRVATASSRSQLLSTAFLNPDGELVVVVMNQTNNPTDFHLWVDGKAAKTKAPAHSIITLRVK
jgi:glucosylceramidase